jgi:pimeloyl-ACP methyl ester carboxylesterase
MPAVFVHGVPETHRLWDGVRAHLRRSDTVAVALPSFGNPRPDGFTATKDAYADWLLGELDRLSAEGPIDLVGHDWGGILTLRIATAFGDRLRSWASDAVNIVHEDYVWHDFAKIWQTPGEGEAFFEQTLAAPVSETAAIFTSMGVPEADAMAMVGAGDAEMYAAILDLYRSAVPNAHHDWGGDITGPTAAPGMVMLATDDPFGDERLSRAMADRVGARVEVLQGLGHWWALQDPARGAAALEAFWATL